MKRTIDIKYLIGETVILITEPEIKRVVSAYLVRSKAISYLLKKGDEEAEHYEAEIQSTAKPFKVKGFKK